jgi:hypothetical protein
MSSVSPAPKSPVSAFFKSKDLSLASIACVPGGGKTTFRELLVTVLTYVPGMCNQVHSVDMSDLLERNAAGRSTGALVTNDLVTTAITTHFSAQLSHNPRIHTVVWSGWPRDIRQGEESASFARRGILHLDTPTEIARVRYLTRWKKTPPDKRRPDDPQTLEAAEKMFNDRKIVFGNTVIPMLAANRDRVVTIDRTRPLLLQLADAVVGLSRLSNPPIERVAATRILSALDHTSHPIHRLIQEIECPTSPRPAILPLPVVQSHYVIPDLSGVATS